MDGGVGNTVFTRSGVGQRLHVISSESLDEIAALLPDVELLVVDEAHHLTSDSAEATGLYEVVRLRSATLPRLLLLSATPVLGNEGEFHKLLHLLDPVTYPLNDVAAFKSASTIARKSPKPSPPWFQRMHWSWNLFGSTISNIQYRCASTERG